jgi:Hint domain
MPVRKFDRTRRNVLAVGGLLAGATVSQIGIKPAQAWHEPPPHCDPGDPSCFLRGTSIRTSNGEQKIEDIRLGDLVITGDGRASRIEWIGRQRYRRVAGTPWLDQEKPVKIAKGALALGVPDRDLFVSQIHALFLDGLLVMARDLVNGSSITVYPASELEELEYLHIKLVRHNTVFAHGALTETLRIENASMIDTFENGHEYEQAFGARARTAEIPCAPIVVMRGNRDRLRSRLRSALSPWIDRRNAFDTLRDRLEEKAERAA